jgi:hypothetical protein
VKKKEKRKENKFSWGRPSPSLSLLTLFSLLFSLFICIPVFAQNSSAVREELWVCPVLESSLYSVSNLAIGSGVALGYGDRVAFGLKVIYWDDMNEVRALELNFLVRFYFFRLTMAEAGHSGIPPSGDGPSGPFIQFNIGPVIFAWDEQNITMPSETAMTSAGLSLGWRFLFGDRLGGLFFLEPCIRVGTPYLFGAGLSAGVRF